MSLKIESEEIKKLADQINTMKEELSDNILDLDNKIDEVTTLIKKVEAYQKTILEKNQQTIWTFLKGEKAESQESAEGED